MRPERLMKMTDWPSSVTSSAVTSLFTCSCRRSSVMMRRMSLNSSGEPHSVLLRLRLSSVMFRIQVSQAGIRSGRRLLL